MIAAALCALVLGWGQIELPGPKELHRYTRLFACHLTPLHLENERREVKSAIWRKSIGNEPMPIHGVGIGLSGQIERHDPTFFALFSGKHRDAPFVWGFFDLGHEHAIQVALLGAVNTDSFHAVFYENVEGGRKADIFQIEVYVHHAVATVLGHPAPTLRNFWTQLNPRTPLVLKALVGGLRFGLGVLGESFGFSPQTDGRYGKDNGEGRYDRVSDIDFEEEVLKPLNPWRGVVFLIAMLCVGGGMCLGMSNSRYRRLGIWFVILGVLAPIGLFPLL